MMQRFTLLSLLYLMAWNVSIAQSGCPGCTVNLPPLPSDTIYLGTAPDGVTGEFYDGDLSFRMPKSTTPVNAVDPGTPGGLGIGKITIVSVLNVPPGLDWEPSQFEFDPDNETDGCVKFCGVPLQPGFYDVQVFITAEVSLITQSTSFSFPFYIAPSVSSTDGFSIVNSTGCGELTVDFENNVPSNGNPGYTYSWDFGNGQISTDEIPGPVTFDTPGVYEVNYEAVIDTFGYELTTVQIVAAGCDDTALPPIFNGAPDFYLRIRDSNGDQILSTSPVTNSPIPSAFNINIPLAEGDYELEVRDEDLFGDDHCGTVVFNRNTNDTLIDGSLQVIVSIIHPVFTVQSTDTVYVFDFPPPPVVSPDGNIDLCEGDELAITTDYQENIQWYVDSVALPGATDPSLFISSPGSYWAEYTSDQGCKSVSAPVSLAFQPIPYPPAFHPEGNLLVLNNPDLLPADYSLQWYIGDEIIPGATETTYCNTEEGVYLFTLEVTDNETGCFNEFSIGIAFDPDFDCTVSTREWAGIEKSLRLFPNPVRDQLRVDFSTEKPMEIEFRIRNVEGKPVIAEKHQTNGFTFDHIINLQALPVGLYLFELISNEGIVTKKFVKK